MWEEEGNRAGQTRYWSNADIADSLERALKVEKAKWAGCPLHPNSPTMFVGIHEWGWIVAGYHLIEIALTGIAIARTGKRKRTHKLVTLYNEIPNEDQNILSGFYDDYRATAESIRGRGSERLEEFLENLDGPCGGNGSVAWRFLVMEKRERQEVPIVNIDLMHEVTYGCIQLMQLGTDGREEALQQIFSERMEEEAREWDRRKKLMTGEGPKGEVTVRVRLGSEERK